MTLSSLLSSTPLMECRDGIRTIFNDDTLFSGLLTDSQKGEVVIPQTALSSVNNTRSHALSVHHKSEEEPDDDQTDLNGIEILKGTIYVDVLRRMNKKDGNIFDEIDIMAHSALMILRQAPGDLDLNIAGWEYGGSKIYIPNDQTVDSPVLTLIKELKIFCFYSNVYTAAYNEDSI